MRFALKSLVFLIILFGPLQQPLAQDTQNVQTEERDTTWVEGGWVCGIQNFLGTIQSQSKTRSFSEQFYVP